MDFVFNQIPNKLIPFDWKTFTKSTQRFVTVCTDCETGGAAYFEKTADMDPNDFFTTLTASASMPYAAPLVSYKGKKYLVGAIVDAIPLKKAVSEGFTKNVIVLTNPAGFYKKEEPHPPDGLLYFGRSNLIRALKLRVTRYNQSLKHAEAEEQAGRAIIIRPSVDLGVSRVERSKEKLLRLYELGINDAKDAIRQNVIE
jgi:predicted patatin/cPLA2 family phospholipase